MRLERARTREATVRELTAEAARVWGDDRLEALAWNLETVGAALARLGDQPLDPLEWEPDFVGVGPAAAEAPYRAAEATEPPPAPGDAVGELHSLGVAEIVRRVERRQLSPVELTRALLERIEALEPRLHAWAALDPDRTLAAACEAERAAGQSGRPLNGMPFGAKDIFYTAGLRTEANSPLLAGFVPAQDAAAVARLRAAGAVLLGKTVTTQFADGDPSPTRNPWNTERSPGGSSAGSAAAVGAHCLPAALGTQTAGSVVRPAGFCGAVGLKPTFGRVSRRNVLPFAWSLDTMGVMARSVEDVALLLEALAGHDPRDPASAERPAEAYARLSLPGRPPRLALLTTCLDRSRPGVAARLRAVASDLAAAGAEVRDAAFPGDFDLALACHTVIQGSEAAEVHAWPRGEDHDVYAPRLRAVIEVGSLVPAQAYARAQRLRRRLREAVDALLADVDALLLPTCSHLAPELTTTGDTSFQGVWTMLGLPSLTLPAGLSDERLPYAVQLVGRAWGEVGLLRAGRWCEPLLGRLPAPL